MTIKTVPDISPTIVFKFENSCNCKYCCIPLCRTPSDKSHVYVNKDHKIERFDKKKGTQGDEDQKTWDRLNEAIRDHLQNCKIADTEEFFKTLQDKYEVGKVTFGKIIEITDYVNRFLLNQKTPSQ